MFAVQDWRTPQSNTSDSETCFRQHNRLSAVEKSLELEKAEIIDEMTTKIMLHMFASFDMKASRD